jgi:anti-sigma28 factor (negative regulator of flagellin synthesis)
MEISGPGPLSPGGSFRPGSSSRPVSAGSKPATTADAVEVSEAARRLAGGSSEANPLRAKRLAAIRESIENGTYETTERLEAALSRFLVEVGAHS